MTNWKTKTSTGAMETKEQSIQSSIHLAVEQVTANIAMIQSLKELTNEIMEISIAHSESVRSLLLKLAEEMENYEAMPTVTARIEKGGLTKEG